VDVSLVGNDREIVSANSFVATVFVSCLDGESEVGEAGGGVVCSRSAFQFERGVFDGLVLDGDLNGDRAGLKGGIFDIVGTIIVVGDLRSDGFVGAVDFNDKRVATVLSGVSVIVNSVDGEACGFVVPQLSDTFSLCITLRWINRPFDSWVEGSIFDGFIVERHVDGVFSGGIDLVSNIVGTITIVLEGRSDLFRTCDVDDEGVSTSGNRVSVSINRVNGELARLSCFTLSKTWSISI